ncbi:MAG: hypothetical protein RIS64_658 [Bacteroidota bacterium]|jgi:hypothetical protein
MARVTISIDELVATLKRSNLPTILVEGDDDVMVYRQFEKQFGARKVSILPCGGRNTLLKVFERKHEFPHLKVHFIADKDMWVFEGVPEKYATISFTSGYSIENDLYADGFKRLDALLDEDELIHKKELLENIVEWFASEVEKYLNDGNEMRLSEFTLLSPKVMEKSKNHFTTIFLTEQAFVKPTSKMIELVQSENYKRLRGKYLFEIYTKIFEFYRKAKDVKSVTYHKNQLMDICYREGVKSSIETTCMQKMIHEIKIVFGL